MYRPSSKLLLLGCARHSTDRDVVHDWLAISARQHDWHVLHLHG